MSEFNHKEGISSYFKDKKFVNHFIYEEGICFRVTAKISKLSVYEVSVNEVLNKNDKSRLLLKNFQHAWYYLIILEFTKMIEELNYGRRSFH